MYGMAEKDQVFMFSAGAQTIEDLRPVALDLIVAVFNSSRSQP